MRISWNWLRRYIDTDLTPQQAGEILTSTGLEVEGVTPYEQVRGMLRGVVVGEVLGREQHPDADRLSVCVVDLGIGEPVRIVCGAPNVAAGQKVLVATVGSTLHMKDGSSITIKKSKIRGEESNGMICAEDELGLGDGHDGIMVLDPSAITGTSATSQLGLTGDHVLEIGLTPNRTDAMGHTGVARDLVAALRHRRGMDLELQWPDVSAFSSLPVEDDGSAVKVEVRDPVACLRYAGLTLRNVVVGPSPAWLRDLLLAIGLKPINNVVDVTNFIQHELGQPLHAFDADTLSGGRIVVRKAAQKEPFTTLDGKARELDVRDLVIADGEKPACIAGVFGGEKSGVGPDTTRVFLESAIFEPAGIRGTSRRHALNTDASFRFERGVDPEMTIYALKRAALLLVEIAGARVCSEITDIDHMPRQHREVRVEFSAIEKLAGLRIPDDDVVRILESLDLRVKERTTRSLLLQVPKYRVDVYRPADVVEEVLRIHGFDHVPIPERLMCPPVHHEALDMESLGRQLANHLAARGLREVMTPSLTNSAKLQQAGGTTTGDVVALRNPLSAELDVLRPVLLPGMLQAIAHNINRQQRDLRFFERGRVYGIVKGRATESDRLAVAITGMNVPERWRNEQRKTTLLDLKEEAEAILMRLGLSHLAEWEPSQHPQLEGAFELLLKGHRAGSFGGVTKPVLKLHDVAQPVFYGEFDELVLLQQCRSQELGFQEIARTPAVRRDLSLLLDAHVRFAQLRKLAFTAGRGLLKEVDLFDVYEGKGLPEGRKSYAISFILQDPAKTLTDAQVDKTMERIRHSFEKELGAVLRS